MQLLDYLPPQMRGITEFQALAAAEQPELDALAADVGGMAREFSALTATEYGIRRLERTLKVRLRSGDTLEARRARVLAKLGESLPYTLRTLHGMLTALCGEDGYRLKLEYAAYWLRVRVAVSRLERLEEARQMLRRVVPANMMIVVEPDYNTHEMLSPYTHRQLAAHTHRALREELSLRGGA